MYWGILIVIYPYLSGLVAGSFIVGALSKVFGAKQFEPLAKLAAIVTLALLLIAALAPLADARQPSRFLELYTRPHVPYAPMGLFPLIWTVYVLLALAETYFIFRQDNIYLADRAAGWRAVWHRWLTFGWRDVSPRAQRREHAILVVLAAFGILLAFAFHGYIGFIFGSLKARHLWSNPLMMPLFIVSAIVSGIALMILAYVTVVGGLVSRQAVDTGLVARLMNLLMWTIFVDLFLDLVDFLNAGVQAYTTGPTYAGFHAIFMGGPLTFMYWGLQLGFLTAAMILTFFPMVRRSRLGASITSLLVLVSVYAMRYDTVIGGQLQPKVSQGLVQYSPPWLGRDSVQTVVGVFAIAILLIALQLLLLPWDQTWIEYWTRHSR
ncbi:MAG: polysulfide reductase NrfD [Thermaerobacter sp.]|nr:polysulfide reductase NrfD [Thermaerobacter sp.]